MIYTLLANCKEQDIDPERYLAEVFRRLPVNAPVEQAAALTPARLAEELSPGQPRPAGQVAGAQAA